MTSYAWLSDTLYTDASAYLWICISLTQIRIAHTYTHIYTKPFQITSKHMCALTQCSYMQGLNLLDLSKLLAWIVMISHTWKQPSTQYAKSFSQYCNLTLKASACNGLCKHFQFTNTYFFIIAIFSKNTYLRILCLLVVDTSLEIRFNLSMESRYPQCIVLEPSGTVFVIWRNLAN